MPGGRINSFLGRIRSAGLQGWSGGFDPVPSYYAFIANDVPRSMIERTTADEICNQLLSHGFWAFTEAAPLRGRLEDGDKILVYLAGSNRRKFVAHATVNGPASKLEPSSVHQKILASLGMPFMAYQVGLRSISQLEPEVAIRPLIPRLEFITEKKNYGLHLRLPIVRLTENDYKLILASAEQTELMQMQEKW